MNSTFRLIIAVYATAIGAALTLGPRGPVYWDTFDYLRQALSGQVGGLALGRPAFVLASHALVGAFRRLGGSVWDIEPFLRACWMAVACSAAPAASLLARRCGCAPAGAWAAGLCVALSPAMAHTSAAVLTDAPALATTLWALVVGAAAVKASGHARVLALAAGALAGTAFGMREQSLICVVSLALMLRAAPSTQRLSLALLMTAGAMATAVVPLAFVLATQSGYVQTVANWVEAMRTASQSSRPTGWWFLLWIVTLGPATVVAATLAWTRRLPFREDRDGLLVAVCVPSVLQLSALLFYPYLAYSPRYLLPVLPGAFAIPAAVLCQRSLGLARVRLIGIAVAALVVPILAAVPVVHRREAPLRSMLRSLREDLRAIPARSTVVTGQLCPATQLVQSQRSAGGEPADEWLTICPGWSWPSDLPSRLDADRASGRTLVLDLRKDAWLGAEQQAALAELARYVERHPSGATSNITTWTDR